MNDIDTLKAMMRKDTPEELRKSLTAATGFVGYNLEQKAKLLLPLFAGLRNRMPVDRAAIGAPTAVWRMQLGYGSYNFGTNMGTAAGGIGGATTPSAVTVAADYKTQAIAGSVQWEAISQARGYDDPLAIETSIALSSLIRHDELNILFGNESLLTPPVVAGVPSTATALNTFAAGTWHVKVTAITGEGTMTNAAGNSNVGESAVSNSAAIVVPVGDCDFLDVSWPVVAGALGYKVYCESAPASGVFHLNAVSELRYRKITTAGTTDLVNFGDAIVVPAGQTYVTVNHVQIVTVPVGAITPPAVDGSANSLIFEGLTSWCEKTTMYGTSGLTHIGLDMDGAPLTTVGTGIAEFDKILSQLWVQQKISPSLIITSPAGVNAAGNRIAEMNSASTLRLEVYQERNSVVGGIYIGGYVNKFASSMAGMQATIDLWAHPEMPDGSFLFLSEKIPYQYSREGRGFALDVQTPYTYFELGRTDRSFPFSVFNIQTLKCNHPTAQAYIAGARVDR